MHWRHESTGYGVRTRISDDRLFLPYLVCEYMRITGDVDILNVQIPYLISPELSEWEQSRYERPSISDMSDTIYQHCMKAIRRTADFGPHDILLIHGGDWNDALDGIGDENSGESVWLSCFAYMVVRGFLPFANVADKGYLSELALRLREGVRLCGFRDSRFVRAYTRQGVVLGTDDSEYDKVDLISQAFAVISGICDRDRAIAAMNSAEQLVSREYGLVRLFDPPFSADGARMGYINDYPSGIRENGGQYTHAVCWYIKALCMIGRKDEALSVLKMIDPIRKTHSIEGTQRYKNEPFALSGDVYMLDGYCGQGGWSNYTGSASWLYKVILEDLLGISIEGDTLAFTPPLPQEYTDIAIVFEGNGRHCRIRFTRDGRRGVEIDGMFISGVDKVSLGREQMDIVFHY